MSEITLGRQGIEKRTVVPPEIFSLRENPEETLKFFSLLDLACNECVRVFIDCDRVRSVSIEALLLILSKVKRRTRRCKGIGGNEPKNEKVREIFAQSGFYDFFAKKPPGYEKYQNAGMLKQRVGKRVRESVCAELVHHTTKKLYGTRRKNGGLYRTLIECMANTRDHANIGVSETEDWWVAAYYEQETRIVHFAFLDTGVGVFKSARMQGFLRQLGSFIKILDRTDVLNDLLDAKLGSRTSLPYRGKGLPSVKRAMMRGQIKNLCLLSNDAYLDASTRKGTILAHEFKGTCLTWEVHQ